MSRHPFHPNKLPTDTAALKQREHYIKKLRILKKLRKYPNIDYTGKIVPLQKKHILTQKWFTDKVATSDLRV